jgi:hypothetical protein
MEVHSTQLIGVMAMRHSRHVYADVDTSGLTANCVARLNSLGHGGSTIVYFAHLPDDRIYTTEDGLRVFNLLDVFTTTSRSILLGFGTPNTWTAVQGRKFAAFMFWRQSSYVADIKGRVQCGVIFELRDQSLEAQEAVRTAMSELTGHRGPSCAYLNGQVLDRAGYRLGNGRRLTIAVRPSKLASLVWRHGLIREGRSVCVRIIVAGPSSAGAHFRKVWGKEITAPGRTVKKIYAGHDHVAVPTFPPLELDPAVTYGGRPITVGISRASRAGVWFSYLFGGRPVFTLELSELGAVKGLQAPLQAYPGHRKLITRIKRYGLFNELVAWAVYLIRMPAKDQFAGVPAGTALHMLQLSPGPDEATACKYNYVVLLGRNGQPPEVRLTSLYNQDTRTKGSRVQGVVAWVLAKHVLTAVYSRNLPIAGETWVYLERQHALDSGRIVLCITNGSGTYQPELNELRALGGHLSAYLGVEVKIVDVITGGQETYRI